MTPAGARRSAGRSSVTLLVALAALAACKDGEAESRVGARGSEPRSTRAAELRDVVNEVPIADVSASAEPSPGALETVASEDVATPTPMDDAVADALADDVVTVAMCRVACQNALRLTLAELPEDAAATMRKEVAASLETVCPTQCVKRGSLASVRCVEGARTALALAACPR